MNYLEIVLQGYFNENNKEHLEGYFFREWKKAKKEHYEADEFFNGCLKVIKSWEKHLWDQVHERKKELQLMLYKAKKGTLSYADLEGKTIEQNRQETIEYCEKELSNEGPDGIGSFSFNVHLYSLTNGRISYDMHYSEVSQIKLSINNTFQKIQNAQPISEQLLKTPKYSAKHHALAYIFDCNVSGESVAYSEKVTLKQIGKNRMGRGTGDAFYQEFNKIANTISNLNNISESDAIKFAGEDWCSIVIALSVDSVALEKYLVSKFKEPIRKLGES